jgi:hypothetical protein
LAPPAVENDDSLEGETPILAANPHQPRAHRVAAVGHTQVLQNACPAVKILTEKELGTLEALERSNVLREQKVFFQEQRERSRRVSVFKL